MVDQRIANGDGKMNMPDGKVCTGPIENSTNGTIRFTYPGIYSGREVEDLTLTFKDGKVEKASAIHEAFFIVGRKINCLPQKNAIR